MNISTNSYNSATLLALLAAGMMLAGCARQEPPVPEIPLINLDPAVARLIEQSLAEVRGERKSATAWGKLGSVLMHAEFIEEAGRAFAQAEKLAPTEARWTYLHALMLLPLDPDAALPLLERAAATAQTDGPRLRLAQALVERGRGTEAARHFEKLLGARPDHSPALLGLARCRQSEGRLTDATNLAARCLADRHTARGAHLLLAAVQRATGYIPSATTTARLLETLPADAPWPDPWWEESLALRTGRKARVADASDLMDHRRFAEALNLLAAAARDYPADDEIPYLTGWALNQQQQFAEAERALRLHLRLSPQSAKGHAQLAVALLGQRRYEEAIEILQAGIKLKPAWREFHSNLGFACVQLGRLDEAIGHFRNALLHDPNHAPSCTALGELLARRGDHEEARRRLRQALSLNPSDARAITLLESLERP